jgi:HD-GYP domain-containing protein (c-di-GMP phosphodiesterase class II)
MSVAVDELAHLGPLGREIGRMMDVLDAHHRETRKHCERVGALAAALATRLDLHPDEIHRVYVAGTLHDVGKLAVPVRLLEAPRPLSTEEWSVMHEHTRATRSILMRNVRLARYADDAALHHERGDGSGYPYGLLGKQIPRVTKIVTVADLYDALTHRRPYHATDPAETALRTIEEGAGRWWWTDAIAALRDHVKAAKRRTSEGAGLVQPPSLFASASATCADGQAD